ncbi:MAG: TonB family protein [Steroidobacteraceae bacterium]
MALRRARPGAGRADKAGRSTLVLAAMLLASAMAPVRAADCDARRTALSGALNDTEQNLQVAQVFFELCEQYRGELYFAREPQYEARLTKPGRLARTYNSLSYLPRPDDWQDRDKQPAVVLVVDAKGRVRDVRLVRSSGVREIDVAAVRTFRRAEYRKPGTLDGMPVRTMIWFRIDYTF